MRVPKRVKMPRKMQNVEGSEWMAASVPQNMYEKDTAVFLEPKLAVSQLIICTRKFENNYWKKNDYPSLWRFTNSMEKDEREISFYLFAQTICLNQQLRRRIVLLSQWRSLWQCLNTTTPATGCARMPLLCPKRLSVLAPVIPCHYTNENTMLSLHVVAVFLSVGNLSQLSWHAKMVKPSPGL